YVDRCGRRPAGISARECSTPPHRTFLVPHHRAVRQPILRQEEADTRAVWPTMRPLHRPDSEDGPNPYFPTLPTSRAGIAFERRDGWFFQLPAQFRRLVARSATLFGRKR